jgi:hypothetical protein
MQNNLSIKVEQLAIATSNPSRAISLLQGILGVSDKWVYDTVTTKGKVGILATDEEETVAKLAFNYDLGFELEVLSYQSGPNWLALKGKGMSEEPSISHVGMHVTLEEMGQWRAKMKSLGIPVIQEVFTQDHTNPYLVDNGRKYEYVIFDTEKLLGFDFKIIRRIEKEEQA